MSYEAKQQLLVMYGGKSGEHEISLRSAASVLQALDRKKYHIHCLGGDKTGQWYLTDSEMLLGSFTGSTLPIQHPSSQLVDLSSRLFKGKDAVLPILHGPLYEDGRLQGLLDLAEVPYIGSGHLASALAMDKEKAKIIAHAKGLNVVPSVTLSYSDSEDSLQHKLQDAVQTFGFPLFVKPACLGSSVGTHRVTHPSALMDAVKVAFCYDNKVLVEKSIVGRELELAVIKKHHQVLVSMAGEIRMRDPENFYSYQAKYIDKDAASLILPAPLEGAQLSALQDAAKKAFLALDCEGFARVDFFLEESTQTIYFNEINTLPGFTDISMFPKLWCISGMTYPGLLDELILQAQWQFQQSSRLVRDFA